MPSLTCITPSVRYVWPVNFAFIFFQSMQAMMMEMGEEKERGAREALFVNGVKHMYALTIPA